MGLSQNKSFLEAEARVTWKVEGYLTMCLLKPQIRNLGRSSEILSQVKMLQGQTLVVCGGQVSK